MSSPDAAAAPAPLPHLITGHLLRIFGLGFGLAVVIGGVIGSGIMRNPGVVAAGFMDWRLVLLVWLGGGLVVCIDAMPTVELGSAIPRAGGPYPLATRAFGPIGGLFVGWADWLQIAWITFTAIVGVICLAGGLQGWFIEKTNLFERVVMVAAGVALAYPSNMADVVGFVGFGVVLATQWLRHARGARGAT